MQFREMRRKRQQLSREECERILENGSSGVLAVLGDGGYPYAVPLSYVFDGNALYFHSAKAGHKIDAIIKEEKASFCVVDKDEVVAEEYTTCFRSAIAFGRAKLVTDESELRSAIDRLAAKYAPNDSAENRSRAIEREFAALCMIRFEIEHLSGKEAIELVRKKEAEK